MKYEPMDIMALSNDLQSNLEGEVRFDDGARALYATDSSNYHQVPIGVVIPKSIDDVIQTVELCKQYQVPLLSRGGGTSLAGQCCNVAVIMDFSKYLNKVLSIDPNQKIAKVQPGCVLDTLREATEKFGLTFGPDPSTHSHNTLGGMIGNDSCGVHSLLAAFEGNGMRTADNLEALEVLTYDGCRMRVGATSEDELNQIIQRGGRQGEIYADLKKLREKYADLIRTRYPNIPRRVSGYNLDELLPEKNFNVARALVGTEGTCVVILEATTKLVYSPPVRSLLVLGYPDVFQSADHIMEILAHKPSGLEGLDHLLIKYMIRKKLHPKDVRLLPPGKGWLLVEFGGETKQESDHKAKVLMAELKQKSDAPSMKLFDGKEEQLIWLVRQSGLGATADIPGEPAMWPGWEDSAVAPEKVGPYLRQLKKLFQKYNYMTSLYGHFGQGCIHCRIPFDLVNAEGIKKFRDFMGEAADLVVSFGGSLSGEHGDGQSRAELLPKMFGEELIQAFNEFKSIWDPQWKMNPGKKVKPNHITDNLRLGTNYNPWIPKTHFSFQGDRGSFAYASLRCVGVGECRRKKGGVMCPSYRVTKEEMHSTRGRARLLFEMLQGEVIGKKGWRDENVKKALDLCLACKGCLSDCPVNVNMASYKAEFLSHYYAGKMRPRSAYAFGHIYKWAELASHFPSFVNFFTQTPVLSSIAKFVSGMAPDRQIPKFAQQTFRQWFNSRPKNNVELPKIMLWPDTFTNYFEPEIAIAAVEVLENAGYQVALPHDILCCGRPLYDYGFLNKAKQFLLNILTSLQTEIRNGTYLIGLEPSCVAVFREEMANLLPHHEDAKRLRQQTFLLSEFLVQKAKNYQPPHLHRKAIVQGHCHHKAVIGLGAEEKLMSQLNLEYQVLDSGCCGMAGSFGYEKGERYEVSMRAGEHVLFPAVRDCQQDTLIIANGFSCRTQIREATGKKAYHLAQILQMADTNIKAGKHDV
jgi:FAD/FMN-containing dehydrogenase/Fe-S oxidoreductase